MTYSILYGYAHGPPLLTKTIVYVANVCSYSLRIRQYHKLISKEKALQPTDIFR